MADYLGKLSDWNSFFAYSRKIAKNSKIAIGKENKMIDWLDINTKAQMAFALIVIAFVLVWKVFLPDVSVGEKTSKK